MANRYLINLLGENEQIIFVSLRKHGVLSEKEFQQKKDDLLARI
jgi:hypothetical protein